MSARERSKSPLPRITCWRWAMPRKREPEGVGGARRGRYVLIDAARPGPRHVDGLLSCRRHPVRAHQVDRPAGHGPPIDEPSGPECDPATAGIRRLEAVVLHE